MKIVKREHYGQGTDTERRVSVMRGSGEYGASVMFTSKPPMVEVAVVRFGDNGDYALNYDTPVTDGVLKFAKFESVAALAVVAEIAAL